MDTPKTTHNAGLEDETAFEKTLATDHGLDMDKPGHGPDEIIDTRTPSVAKSDAQTKQPSWAGKIMGHFKLLRLIGKGAMGLVIQAEDTNLKRIVALKVLRKQLSKGEKGTKAVEQFLREARAAAAIEHPNVVRVYEINQHAGWWYIAMEMVSGSSLQEIVKVAGALPASRACPIIADAAIALQVAHELGMIHRDIKPSNILVTRNGHGKVSDFGLVRVDDPNDPFDSYEHQSIGTPLYMAPEVIRRETISSAVDIYSLGATLYYVLMGRPPYVAEEMREVLRQHLHSDPPKLQEYLPDCSPNLASLVQRMMAKEPGARPTATEVAAILNAESIAFFPDTSGTVGPEGSSIGTEWQGILQKTRTSLSDQTVHMNPISSPKRLGLFPVPISIRWWVLLAVMVLLVLSGAFWLYTTKNTKQDRKAVEKLFPDAPASYAQEKPTTD